MTLSRMLTETPRVATAGVDLFAQALVGQGVKVERVDWQPPLPGTEAAEAAARMLGAGAELVDVRPAAEVLGLEPGQFLHAGPPITWERASGPLRGALIGAVLLEGLAATPAEAERRLEAGEGVELAPCHGRGGVGPMAGVVTPGMWLFEVRDPGSGRVSWCSLNEGLGKVLRYGAFGPEVIERLRWMADVLGPVLQRAVRRRGPVDLKAIIAQMLHMGDEGHNRNRAGTLMLLRELLPAMLDDSGTVTAGGTSGSAATPSTLSDVVRFISGNDHFFLNLVMPACKLAASAAADLPGSTVVTVLARNGTDFGIQTSGTGDRWFTAPALVPEGLFLGDYGPADANPDIGDSAITETAGVGGFAMAAAPAIARLVGGTAAGAVATTRRMYEITLAENPAFTIPALDFRGTPTAIDVTRVARTGILPQINTGMAGRVAGTGQIGAGLVTPPAECFRAALAGLAEAARIADRA